MGYTLIYLTGVKHMLANVTNLGFSFKEGKCYHYYITVSFKKSIVFIE